MMMFNLEEHKQCNILVTTPTHTRRDYNTRTYKMYLSSDGCMQIAKKKLFRKTTGSDQPPGS